MSGGRSRFALRWVSHSPITRVSPESWWSLFWDCRSYPTVRICWDARSWICLSLPDLAHRVALCLSPWCRFCWWIESRPMLAVVCGWFRWPWGSLESLGRSSKTKRVNLRFPSPSSLRTVSSSPCADASDRLPSSVASWPSHDIRSCDLFPGKCRIHTSLGATASLVLRGSLFPGGSVVPRRLYWRTRMPWSRYDPPARLFLRRLHFLVLLPLPCTLISVCQWFRL